ncbi:metallo-beta-lactamase domain-containing protein [Diplocarpon mali]|nr:metallo-beta-lactamase domain-containing protein [Diplocarpon mali]
MGNQELVEFVTLPTSHTANITRMASPLVELRDVERLSPRVIRVLGGNPGKSCVVNGVLWDNFKPRCAGHTVLEVLGRIGGWGSAPILLWGLLFPLHLEVHVARWKKPILDPSLQPNGLLGSNTYLVGTGRERLLIDTGEGKPAWIAALKEVLGKENATISRTLITHWHHDHQGGINDLSELAPATSIHKNEPGEGQRDIWDGQRFQVEGATLRAVFSPGHTPDHMALVLEEEDAMFTGDNVLGHGTAVFEDLPVYLDSLEKMRSHFRGRAYPGHGSIIEDGPSKILEYIKHRQMRESQVVRILESPKSSAGVGVASEPDGWTSMDIVQVIYKDVPEKLHLAANGGILQILRKLEAEDQVVADSASEQWRWKNRAAL